MFISLGQFGVGVLIFKQLRVNNMRSLAIMRSCIIVKHLLRETRASTEKSDLPDRAAARIAPEARVQKKRVLVLIAPQTVRAGEANRAVGAVFAIATCEALAPSVKCAMKDAGVNPLAPSKDTSGYKAESAGACASWRSACQKSCRKREDFHKGPNRCAAMIDEGRECSINCKSSLSKAPYMLAIRTLFRLGNVPAPAKLVQSFSAAPFCGKERDAE